MTEKRQLYLTSRHKINKQARSRSSCLERKNEIKKERRKKKRKKERKKERREREKRATFKTFRTI